MLERPEPSHESKPRHGIPGIVIGSKGRDVQVELEDGRIVDAIVPTLLCHKVGFMPRGFPIGARVSVKLKTPPKPNRIAKVFSVGE